MEAYISFCVGGFAAFDKNLKIIDYERFKDDEIHLKIIQNLNDEILEEEINIINRIANNHSTINIESKKRISNYKTEFGSLDNLEIKINITNIGGEHLRGNMGKVLLYMGFESKERIRKLIVDNFNKVARLKMKESSQEEDKLLIQSINAIDEIDEAISKLVERIREWYAIYFPEIEVVNKNEAYVKLIADVGDREKIIESHLKEHGIDIDVSSGADIEIEDLEMIKGFGKSIKSLQESRKAIEKYVDIKMDKIAPNLKNLLGSSLGAKLISHVGSMKKLAFYPSGTIQILGAEKALFRHLKTGEDPPKHGIIYQHPDVRTSKWWIRGKISRVLALKISLSVRKDYFNGKLDEKIKEDYTEKVEKIKKENPFPKKTNKKKKNKRKKHEPKNKKIKRRGRKTKECVI
ncbi:MAG: ATP-binding protein [Methanobrevibacter sp.]|jgi:nucleolar protein 56|nr:ATP-binding protein [Candidatus Methanovirga aequatorialis]